MSEVFAQGVERNIARFMEVLPGDDAVTRRTQTIVTLSSMVGALVLARATAAGNPRLSEEILATLRGHLTAPADAPASAADGGSSMRQSTEVKNS